MPGAMRRFVFCLLFLLPWVSPASAAQEEAVLQPGMVNPGFHEQPAWFKQSFLDIREDVAEAAESDRRVMLYFYQDGCPYCKKLLETNFSQRDIVERTRGHFDVIAINMWGDREVLDFQGKPTTEKNFATDLKVMFTPTLLFLNEQGEVVVRLNGYYAPHKFAAVLDYVGQKKDRDMDFRSFLAANEPVAAKGELHQDPSYLQPPYRLSQRAAKPLLVMFEQKDCAPCDELHQDILTRPESRELLRQFDVVLLDMWADTPVQTPSGRETTAAEWSRALKVQYAPTLVMFDREGKEAFRTEAYLKAFHVQSSLDYVLSGAYRSQPSFQRYIQKRAEALEAQGVHVNLME